MRFHFFLASSWSNRDQVIELSIKLRDRGYKVFTFMDKKENFTVPIAEAMKDIPNMDAWRKHRLFKSVFEQDLKGLKNSQNLILMLPAGKSAHMEAGIAYGLGKKCILLGKPQEADTLYLIFDENYDSNEEFLKSLKEA